LAQGLGPSCHPAWAAGEVMIAAHVASRAALLILLAIPRRSLNEAALAHAGQALTKEASHETSGRSTMLIASQQHKTLLAAGDHAMQALMAKTTLKSALKMLDRKKNVPKELRAFIRQAIGTGRRSNSLASHLRGHSALQRTAGPNQARIALNAMIMDTGQKLDLEQIKGAAYEQTQKGLIQEARTEMVSYSEAGSTARAQVLKSEAAIAAIELRMPHLTQQATRQREQCTKQTLVINKEIEMLADDTKTMQGIMKKTSCGQDDVPMLSLLQCQHKRARARSFIAFGSNTLRYQAARLQSFRVRRAMQRALQGAFQESMPTTTVAPPPGLAYYPKRPDMCTVRQNPNCQRLKDRFWQILTTVMDKSDQLKEEVTDVQRNCKQLQANVQAQIAAVEIHAKESEASLARATEELDEAQEQSRLKDVEVADLTRDYNKQMRKAKNAIRAYGQEICGLKKIRAELFKLENQGKRFIQDCSVSDWSEGECSKPCGGGIQKLTRTVVSPAANGGAACPPLEVMQQCNEEGCPVDCSLGDWDLWSTCSAPCGGGIMERQREIQVKPRHGGDPCEGTTETVACNVQACDRDCSLSEWSEWSSCSKMCNGGLQERRKRLAERAVGAGKCPKGNSRNRLQYKTCNSHQCQASPGNLTVKCNSKVDVMLLLDGSASLNEAGWTATKRASSLLTQSFRGSEHDGAMLSVLLFSGPKTLDKLSLCTQGAQPGQAPPNLEQDCGLTWVERGSDDMGAIARKIDAMQWPKASTFTSSALATAAAELRHGRRHAQSIVVVITDGRPMSPMRTGMAARRLRRKARLMWVPVTRFAPLRKIRSWASKPVRENVVEVPTFQALQKPETINALVANMCPTVS